MESMRAGLYPLPTWIISSPAGREAATVMTTYKVCATVVTVRRLQRRCGVRNMFQIQPSKVGGCKSLQSLSYRPHRWCCAHGREIGGWGGRDAG